MPLNPFEQQQFETFGIEGVNRLISEWKSVVFVYCGIPGYYDTKLFTWIPVPNILVPGDASTQYWYQ